MPIRSDLLKFYNNPEWREVIRPRILARDGHRCKFCKVPDRTAIARAREYPGKWFDFEGNMYDEQGNTVKGVHLTLSECRVKIVRIILGIAHLDNNPENMADDNLAALCSRCHLKWDQRHHRQTYLRSKFREQLPLDLDGEATA